MRCQHCGVVVPRGGVACTCPACGAVLPDVASATTRRVRPGEAGLPARTSIGERTGPVGGLADLLGCPRRSILPMDAPRGAVGDYRLVEPIGAGGMGQVFAARQTGMQRMVALKRLLPERGGAGGDEASFLLEALITARLDHPNIIPIHDMGRDQDELIFYTMRLVRGRPWSESIAVSGLEANVDILLHVCDAVAYAHAQGLIHRDLKPANIMLGDFGEVLVTDWGLAIDLASLHASGPCPRISCGTPAYMAPEMADDDRPAIGTRSDVYLLGGILCELLTGTSPHPGDTVAEALAAAEENRIEPGLPADELGAIAARALATRPADRQGGVKEFQQDLRAWRRHAQSGRLASEAEDLARAAEGAAGYQMFSRAAHTFEEALVLWPENPRAADGLRALRLRYAQRACAAGDLDLAEAQAGDGTPEAEALRQRIADGRQQRQRHARLVRSLTRVSACLLGALILVLGGGLLLSDHQRRLVLSATHARDQAEAQLAHEEGLRQKQERRAWEPVLREDFTAPALPPELEPVGGAWEVGHGQLLAAGAGTSLLALSTDAVGDLRVRFDRASVHALRIYLGVPRSAVPGALAGADAPMVLFDHQCRLYRGGRELAAVDLPARVPGLTQRIAIERDGRMLHVQVDGRPLLGADMGALREAVDPRLVIAADQGTILEDLRVEILHDGPVVRAPPTGADPRSARSGPPRVQLPDPHGAPPCARPRLAAPHARRRATQAPMPEVASAPAAARAPNSSQSGCQEPSSPMTRNHPAQKTRPGPPA